jgi:hypothetical protein
MTIELRSGDNVLNVKLTPKPPKLDDLDFTLLTHIANSIKILDMPKKERILNALNFLYDALAATTDVQAYITINGALDYLTSGVVRGGRTEDSHKKAVEQFVRAGILSDDEEYKCSLHKFHHGHYAVMKSNTISYSQLDEIKEFFKKFLMTYMEYEEMMTRAEHSSNGL